MYQSSFLQTIPFYHRDVAGLLCSNVYQNNCF